MLWLLREVEMATIPIQMLLLWTLVFDILWIFGFYPVKKRCISVEFSDAYLKKMPVWYHLLGQLGTFCFLSEHSICDSVVVFPLLPRRSKISNNYFLELMYQKLSLPLCISRFLSHKVVHLKFFRQFVVSIGLGWFHHIHQITFNFFLNFRGSTVNLPKLLALLVDNSSLFVFQRRVVSYNPP